MTGSTRKLNSLQLFLKHKTSTLVPLKESDINTETRVLEKKISQITNGGLDLWTNNKLDEKKLSQYVNSANLIRDCENNWLNIKELLHVKYDQLFESEDSIEKTKNLRNAEKQLSDLQRLISSVETTVEEHLQSISLELRSCIMSDYDTNNIKTINYWSKQVINRLIDDNWDSDKIISSADQLFFDIKNDIDAIPEDNVSKRVIIERYNVVLKAKNISLERIQNEITLKENKTIVQNNIDQLLESYATSHDIDVEITIGQVPLTTYLDGITNPQFVNDKKETDAIYKGFLKSLVPELIRGNYAKPQTVKASVIKELMAESDLVNNNYWTEKDKNVQNINPDKFGQKQMKTIVSSFLAKDEISDWSLVLSDIRNNTRTASTLKELMDWANDKYEEVGNPLDGINLEGANTDDLLNLQQGASISVGGLDTALGQALRYKENYVALDSRSDGNCGLNAVSILLTGNQNPDIQRNTSDRLRTAICFSIMRDKNLMGERGIQSGDDAKLDWLKFKLLANWDPDPDKHDTDEIANSIEPRNDRTNYPLADYENTYGNTSNPHAWIATDDYNYLSSLISRPITVLYKTPPFSPETGYILKTPFGHNNPQLTYFDNPYLIYNIGDGHFEPLVQKKEHNDGVISFSLLSVKTDPVRNQSIFFEINKLQSSRFSESILGIFNNIPNIKKVDSISIDYSQNKEDYGDYLDMFTKGDSKVGKTVYLDICSIYTLSEDRKSWTSNVSIVTDGKTVIIPSESVAGMFYL